MRATHGRMGSSRRRRAGAETGVLFDAHARLVLGLCRTLLRDPHDAEDAAQQVFLNAHRALLNGTTPLDPAAWLAAIARNECRARIGRRLARPDPLPLLDDVVAASAASDPVVQADQRAEVDALTTALTELPSRQREAVVLREVHGLSYQEVAAAMSVSPPAVESMLSRARRTLETRIRPVRIAQGAPLLVDSLREGLARLIPGFAAPEAAAAVGAGAGGLLAKLASLPLGGKAAGAAAVVGVAVTAQFAIIDRRQGAQSRTPHSIAVAERALPRPEARSADFEWRFSRQRKARRHAVSVIGAASFSGRPSQSPARRHDEREGPEDTRPSPITPDVSAPAETTEGAAVSDSGRSGDTAYASSGPGPSDGRSSNSGPGSDSSDSSGSGSSGSGSSGSGSSGSGSSGSDSSGSGSSGSGSSGSGSSAESSNEPDGD